MRSARVRIVALLALLPECMVQAQSLHEPPPLTSMRWEEDYSYLADPAKRTGAWWEPLKYIPSPRGDRIYLTLGDELRLRYQHIEDNDFASKKRTEGYPMLRWLPYADLQAGALRLFGQLMASYSGRSVETRSAATDETGLEVSQAFVDWR